MRKIDDLTGKRFGMLVVLNFSHIKGKGSFWLCKCDCGREKVIRRGCLIQGHSTSCGCYGREQQRKAVIKHGMANTRTHTSWSQMNDRCNNPNHHAFKRYGGRGINICPEWKDFNVFLKDMGERPQGKTLDRIDNNKGYSPENCRWADDIVQHNNTSKNRILTLDGLSLSVSQWARKLNMSREVINARLMLGWNEKSALMTPIRQRSKNGN